MREKRKEERRNILGALVWDPYLLAWLDGGQGDTLGVDHRQDLVSDDGGNDLALGIG